MAQINVRIDDELKPSADALFNELGLSMSTAINLFIRQAIRNGGLPFEVKIDPFYSAANQAHLEKAIRDYESGKGKPIIKTMAELEDK